MSKQKQTLQQRCQPVSGIEIGRIGATGLQSKHKHKKQPTPMAEKIYCRYNHRQGVSRKTNNNASYYKIAAVVSIVLALPLVWLFSTNSVASIPTVASQIATQAKKVPALDAIVATQSASIVNDDDNTSAVVSLAALTDEIIANMQIPPTPVVSNETDSETTAIEEPTDDSLIEAQDLLVAVGDLAEEAQILQDKISATETETASVETKTVKTVAKKPDTDWLNITVKAGDNLSNIFDKHNLNRSDLHRMLEQKKSARMLRRLKPGQSLRIKQGENGSIESLALDKALQINRAEENEGNDLDDSFEITINGEEVSSKGHISQAKDKDNKTTEQNKHIVSATGVIHNTMFAAGREAGLSRKQVNQLTKIFRWDIDFTKNIRKGDQFTVLYEEYLDETGKQVKLGDIVAAEFINRSKRYQSIYYVDPKGHGAYHKPDGKIMRKTFLRAPVNVGKVTSRFSIARRNPVLHKIRAHKGVDYGAPVGTPVYAAGAGVVKYKGWKRGYGRTVVLQHGKQYSTLYAHLSKFPKGLKAKQQINQGKIIGYVGSSGRATGPHLHYEFLVNGIHKNPLSVTGLEENGHTVPAEYRKDFHKKSQVLLARLNEVRQVAQAKTDSKIRNN